MSKRILFLFACILSVFVSGYLSVSLYFIIRQDLEQFLYINMQKVIETIEVEPRVFTIFIIIEIAILAILFLFSKSNKNIYHSKTIKLTDKLEIPNLVGEGQHRNILVAR